MREEGNSQRNSNYEADAALPLKELMQRVTSLKLAIGTLELNSIDLDEAYEEFISELSGYINENFEENMETLFPVPLKSHIELKNILIFRLCNYLSSYKVIIEIINAVINTATAEVTKEISDFVDFISTSDIFRAKKLGGGDDGLIVLLRNQFDHNIIAPISIFVDNAMFVDDWVAVLKERNPSKTEAELTGMAVACKTSYPNAGLFKRSGDIIKRHFKVLARIDESWLSRRSVRAENIIKANEESADLIKLLLEQYQALAPYLTAIQQSSSMDSKVTEP